MTLVRWLTMLTPRRFRQRPDSSFVFAAREVEAARTPARPRPPPTRASEGSFGPFSVSVYFLLPFCFIIIIFFFFCCPRLFIFLFHCYFFLLFIFRFCLSFFLFLFRCPFLFNFSSIIIFFFFLSSVSVYLLFRYLIFLPLPFLLFIFCCFSSLHP